MHIAHFLAGAAAAALTVSAAAQDMPVDPPASERVSTLSDLSRTVDSLSDDSPAQSASPDTASPRPDAPPSGSATTPPGDAPPAARAVARPGQPSALPMPLSAEQLAELERSVARGRQLFAIARAGLLATQDMLSRVTDPAAAGISGWIAQPEGNAMAVTFYGDSDSGPVAIYRARILAGRAVSRETHLTGERPPLDGLAGRMARARNASEAEDQRACTPQPFNVLAIPPAAADGPIDIYRITAPESRTKLPLGGHFRSTVGADGRVAEARAFSRGCLNVDISEVAPGTQASPIAVTHLLDPLPTEIHVFLSLFSGRPLLIAAGDPTRLFMVAGDSIREIRR